MAGAPYKDPPASVSLPTNGTFPPWLPAPPSPISTMLPSLGAHHFGCGWPDLACWEASHVKPQPGEPEPTSCCPLMGLGSAKEKSFRGHPGLSADGRWDLGSAARLSPPCQAPICLGEVMHWLGSLAIGACCPGPPQGRALLPPPSSLSLPPACWVSGPVAGGPKGGVRGGLAYPWTLKLHACICISVAETSNGFLL